MKENKTMQTNKRYFMIVLILVGISGLLSGCGLSQAEEFVYANAIINHLQVDGHRYELEEIELLNQKFDEDQGRDSAICSVTWNMEDILRGSSTYLVTFIFDEENNGWEIDELEDYKTSDWKQELIGGVTEDVVKQWYNLAFPYELDSCEILFQETNLASKEDDIIVHILEDNCLFTLDWKLKLHLVFNEEILEWKADDYDVIYESTTSKQLGTWVASDPKQNDLKVKIEIGDLLMQSRIEAIISRTFIDRESNLCEYKDITFSGRLTTRSNFEDSSVNNFELTSVPMDKEIKDRGLERDYFHGDFDIETGRFEGWFGEEISNVYVFERVEE